MRSIVIRCLTPAAAVIGIAACDSAELESPQGMAAIGDPPKAVAAAVETIVPTDPAVDADDPALWADPRDPRRAMLFATDKSDGLYVHDIEGNVRQFFADGPLNNVDLRSGFRVAGRDYVLVAATERRRFGIMTYLFDPDSLETRPYGFIPTNMGEPYGFCMGKRGEAIYLVPNNKAGDIRIYRVEAGPSGPVAILERSLKVASQPEGCVVDDEAQHLYVGEEDVGIWRFAFGPSEPATALKVASVDNRRLTADVEGLAILRDGGAKYLIASSQGDSTFPIWRVAGDRYLYQGRIAVVPGKIDGVFGTDGIDAWSGPIGQFSGGAIAVHDDDDGAGQQNYKIIDWRSVKEALRLP